MTGARKAWAAVAEKSGFGLAPTLKEGTTVCSFCRFPLPQCLCKAPEPARKSAKALAKPKKRPPLSPKAPDAFCGLCRASGLPEPVREFQFAKEAGRRWRFDYAWPHAKVALEVDGGLFSGGGHVRGAHILTTHEKMNTAAIAGWRILYTTPAGLTAMLPLLKLALTPP